MAQLSTDIGGRFTEYDPSNAVIIVPLGTGRYQTILACIYFSEELMSEVVEFSSKVCNFHDGINLKMLLAENKHFHYSKFSVVDGFIKIEATTYLDELSGRNNELLKNMVLEIAQKADEWERKLTGLDVY
jgi:hypothetical protein